MALDDGTAWCWGAGGNGQMGNGGSTDRLGAVRVTVSTAANLDDVVHICAGGLHSCAAQAGGTAW